MNNKRKSGSLLFLLAACSLLLVSAALLRAKPPAAFNGQRAFDDMRRLVSFGPRPVGSAALSSSRRWMMSELAQSGCHVEQDAFTASTPIGRVDMDNLIVKIPGASPSIIMIAGHYDTKLFNDFRFVGANDGGSSAAFLMEMGRSLCRSRNKYTLWLVFFDGEEAIQQWSATDGTYGSRHLEQKLAANGELSRVEAMILVDMIGDANLDIRPDLNSTAWLNHLLFKTADRLGYSRYFLKNQPTAIEDDHIPFVQAGVSAVDIIDLDYGPDNSYWHTAQDTPEHCSAASMAIVGRVVTALLKELDSSSRLH